MVVSRISTTNKNENQEKLSIIRDPFYPHRDPIIPDGSASTSGGFCAYACFEIVVPTSLQDDIDIMVMPSHNIPVCYRKAGTPWTSASVPYENVICPKYTMDHVQNDFAVNLPSVVGPPSQNITIETFQSELGPSPKFNRWRHVSSAVRISPVQATTSDAKSVLLVRNNPLKMDPTYYSLLSPVNSVNNYPNGLQAFTPSTRTNVVIAPDFDPYQQLSDVGNYGFFKNMKGVWCGSLQEASKYRFQLRPNDMFFDRANSWNKMYPKLGAVGYIDTSRIGCPLDKSPYGNDREILESTYDFRFDGLQIRIWNPPGTRAEPIRVRVEYQGNFEGILSKGNIGSANPYQPGQTQERHNLLSAYLDIYRDQQRNRVPGVLL